MRARRAAPAATRAAGGAGAGPRAARTRPPWRCGRPAYRNYNIIQLWNLDTVESKIKGSAKKFELTSFRLNKKCLCHNVHSYIAV